MTGGTGQLPLDLAHRPALGREDFLVAPANASAVDWIDRWPNWPAPALSVFGPAGCGKTHLGEVWRARSGATTIAARDLPHLDPSTAIGPGGLVVEAATDAAGEVAAERALFHLYNIARDGGRFLLLLSRDAPSRAAFRLPDLASRLRGAPSVGIAAPDDALLEAMLVKLFADRQLRPGREVVAYLLIHMERSAEAARSLVAAIDRASLAARRPVTVPLAREVLAQAAET